MHCPGVFQPLHACRINENNIEWNNILTNMHGILKDVDSDANGITKKNTQNNRTMLHKTIPPYFDHEMSTNKEHEG